MAPFKRARQPKITTQSLLDFDLGESSSDSDFRIEDHNEDCSGSDLSKDYDDNDSSGEESSSDSEDNDGEADDSEDSTQQLKLLLAEDVEKPQTNGCDDLEAMLQQLDSKEKAPNVPTKPICCVCLGDRSDDSNEIVECDGCGVSVHEGCYGVSDNASISSTNSTCSTEPWFCEACRAGISEPICELCPNRGGIYKETDVGRWVHLVCALYIPGVAFGEVDQLSSVTLFEMPYNKWGAKVCSLCENARFARVGVCIGCDAGMCKTYFHVTCAQTAGFLTEAHHEEAEVADPFYAHCKVHSEKEMIKKRKRNFHTFRLNMQQKQKEKLAIKLEDPCPAQMRIQRKLLKHQRKYAAHKQQKADPWVPTQKMSRLLTTSASACKRLLAKADIMTVNVELMERQEAQITALTDIRKKWHIAPAFSVEFIGYYLDRISRSQELKHRLTEMVDSNRCLSREQDCLRTDYDTHLEKNKELKRKQESLISNIELLHKHLTTLCPNKSLPQISHIGRALLDPPKASTPPTRPISVPTAAALKMGVGFPLAHLVPPGSKVDSTRLLSTHAKNSPTTVMGTSSAPSTPTLGVQTYDCGICKRCTDQHLLAKCDTCQLHYHLGCLNPPLSRHPKKSKLYGWQCSECDKSDESEGLTDLPKGPRKARTRFNKDGSIALQKSAADKLPVTTNDDREMIQATKRRASDTAPLPKMLLAATGKILNKSLPVLNITPITIAPSVTAITAAPKAATSLSAVPDKKSKLSLSYVAPQNSKEKPIATAKAAPMTQTSPSKNRRGGNISAADALQPVHVSLSTEEPLLMVIPQTSTPCSGESMQVSDPDPLALPMCSNTAKSVSSLDDSSDPSKQARKQKKRDKHKNKHNLSSDTEKSPNKEHKRKRKKKVHGNDAENPNESASAGGIPKIKIKFKTLPLPGEVTPEAQFFYVSADMVRSAEEASRPTSVETVEDIAAQPLVEEVASPKLLAEPTVAISGVKATPASVTPIRKISPRKANQRMTIIGRPRSVGQTQNQTLNCCVCRQIGVPSNVVTCDECRKNYHFICLDPPLKKTPKIRGYSWHCADCDPTEDDTK